MNQIFARNRIYLRVLTIRKRRKAAVERQETAASLGVGEVVVDQQAARAGTPLPTVPNFGENHTLPFSPYDVFRHFSPKEEKSIRSAT